MSMITLDLSEKIQRQDESRIFHAAIFQQEGAGQIDIPSFCGFDVDENL